MMIGSNLLPSLIHPCGCPRWGSTLNVFCCFIYQGASLSRTVSTFIKPITLFIAWGRTLAQPFPLGQAECFSSAQRHIALLLSCGVRLRVGAKKNPLTAAPVVVPHKRGEACVNGFHSLTTTTTMGIIHRKRWLLT